MSFHLIRIFIFSSLFTLFAFLLWGDSSPITHAPLYWFNNPQFQKLLDDQTHSKAYTGNQITLLINGEASFKRRKENIATADVILLKAFELWDDETGREVIRQLAERAKKEAKIFIQFDVKGFYNNYNDLLAIKNGKKDPLPSHLQKLLAKSHDNVFITVVNIPATFLETVKGLQVPRDHEKYLITWEYKNGVRPVKAIMGGMNIGNMYAYGGREIQEPTSDLVASSKGQLGFRDTDIEVVGPVVQDIVNEFIFAEEYHLNNENPYFQRSYAARTKEAIDELKKIRQDMQEKSALTFPHHAGSAFARFVVNPPHKAGKSININQMLILLFKHCPKGETIRITSAAFLPMLQIEQAMIAAAKRGVFFDLLLNKAPLLDDPDLSYVAYAARCRYRYFLTSFPNNSFDFYDWAGDSALNIGKIIHQKIFAFGLEEQAPFAIGSYNLDAHSSYWNSEAMLLIQSTELKKQVDDMLNNDFFHSAKVSLHTLDEENVTERFYQCFLNWFFHPLL